MKDDIPEDLLIKKLADAIQKTLSNSKVVRKAIEAIEKKGHECILSFSAAVVMDNDENDVECCECSEICQDEIFDSEDIELEDKEDSFEFDADDIKFLKSINIKL